MTKTEKIKNEVLSTLHNWGWTRDRWGHMKKNSNGRLLRVKVQKKSFRLERQYKDTVLGKTSWIRISSDFFGKCKVEDHGIVIGGVRIKEPKDKRIC